MMELGPFLIQKGKPELALNPHSWNKGMPYYSDYEAGAIFPFFQKIILIYYTVNLLFFILIDHACTVLFDNRGQHVVP
jgi:hypothetical protein